MLDNDTLFKVVDITDKDNPITIKEGIKGDLNLHTILIDYHKSMPDREIVGYPHEEVFEVDFDSPDFDE